MVQAGVLLLLGVLLLPHAEARYPELGPQTFLYFTLEAPSSGGSYALTVRVEEGPPVRLLVLDGEGFESFRWGREAHPEFVRWGLSDSEVVVSLPHGGTWYFVLDQGGGGSEPTRLSHLALYRITILGARSPLLPYPEDPFRMGVLLHDGVAVTWLSLVFLGLALLLFPYRSPGAFVALGGFFLLAYLSSESRLEEGVLVHLGWVLAGSILLLKFFSTRTRSPGKVRRLAFSGSFLGLWGGGDFLRIFTDPLLLDSVRSQGRVLLVGGDGWMDGIIAGPILVVFLWWVYEWVFGEDSRAIQAPNPYPSEPLSTNPK